MNPELDAHLGSIVGQLKWGEVVPFLGAGASLAGRPAPAAGEDPESCPACARPLPRTLQAWDPASHSHLPSGQELALYLASDLQYTPDEPQDLVRVAEYVATMASPKHLYRLLRNAFNADYPPTKLHELLARLPGQLRAKGGIPLQVVVTTNYDDLLERAFRDAGEPIDVFTYMAVGREEGRFIHFPPDDEPRVVTKANEYPLDLDDEDNLVRPAILKIHGTVHRVDREHDSFVITEDDYIDYLTREISSLLPKILITKLQESTILFLGYSLRDWNVRAMFRRIWDEAQVPTNSWAIQQHPDLLDRKSWETRNVRILPISLDEYVDALGARLEALPDARAQPHG
jgi:hypothetical protein